MNSPVLERSLSVKEFPSVEMAQINRCHFRTPSFLGDLQAALSTRLLKFGVHSFHYISLIGLKHYDDDSVFVPKWNYPKCPSIHIETQ